MRVALVSYEYAGVSAGGGIGTYVRNAAAMLSGGGHQVHVFTSGPVAGTTDQPPALYVSTVPATREEFPDAVLPVFRGAQDAVGFDLLEGPEYGCDAKVIADTYPQIPFAVRLHGPSFSILNSNAHYVGRQRRWRFALGTLRRGRWPRDPWKPDAAHDPERQHVLQADEIVANSQATAALCNRAWGLPSERLSVVPLSFMAPADLLALRPAPRSRTVLFLGRMEVRKGVLELARAVPLVLRHYPDVTFRMVGQILPHPDDGRPVADHVRELVGAGTDRVQITGGVPYLAIPAEFARASICVFPSDWEASGLACFEGMVAGRAVVGSQAGGMAEIIEHGRNGLLVPHRNPRAIAEAVEELLGSPETCQRLGEAGRQTITDRYAPHTILPLQLAAYHRAIANARARNVAVRYGEA